MSTQTAPAPGATPCQQDAPARQNTVKKALTRKPRRTAVENDSYAAFTRRILRAYARRIAAGDIDALTLITDLSAEVDAAAAQAVTGLRGHGYSWAEIATRLGVTRQAAQQRWGGQPSH
jgi:uncharacterized protein YgbK (DUF1537 family)